MSSRTKAVQQTEEKERERSGDKKSVMALMRRVAGLYIAYKKVKEEGGGECEDTGSSAEMFKEGKFPES